MSHKKLCVFSRKEKKKRLVAFLILCSFCEKQKSKNWKTNWKFNFLIFPVLAQNLFGMFFRALTPQLPKSWMFVSKSDISAKSFIRVISGGNYTLSTTTQPTQPPPHRQQYEMERQYLQRHWTWALGQIHNKREKWLATESDQPPLRDWTARPHSCTGSRPTNTTSPEQSKDPQLSPTPSRCHHHLLSPSSSTPT